MGKKDKYALTLVDLRAINEAKSRVESGDVRDYTRMQALCDCQDVLVHLAIISQQHFGKTPGEVTDIGASMLLFEAAREAGIHKIVYAGINACTRLERTSEFTTAILHRESVST